jgi:hypothetical protein
MNLIELSNNLKDVPDHYLMNEVQQPTGAYPAYLVISELTRRKGMRDRALKNDPKSTVVEDLTQPNREQMMSAVAQMQQPAPQQQPLPPQMPMPPQIPQMPAAGLMATPQASSLAATDAMASPRKRMAGGGLVAFQEGGDVKRFQQGGMPFELLQTANQSDSNKLDENLPALSKATQKAYGSLSGAVQGMFGSPEIKKIDPETGDAVSLGEYMRRQQAKEVAIGAKTIQMQKDAAQAATQKQVAADQVNAENMGPPRPNIALSRGSLGGSAVKSPEVDPFAAYYPKALPTEEEFAAAQQRQTERYNKDVPDRLVGTEKELGTRTQNLKDRRKSALNEALMMAGIGVLKSKSPGRYFGEGAEEGMLAYRQSMKDVRGGEDLMTQARQDLAKSQLLQDQARYSAGQAGRQNMLDQYKATLEGQQVGGNLAAKKREQDFTAAELPSKIAGNYGLADLYKARSETQGENSASVEAAKVRAAYAMGKTDPKLLATARTRLMALGIFDNHPQYDQQLAEEYQRLMGLAGASAQPAAPKEIRGVAEGARQ